MLAGVAFVVFVVQESTGSLARCISMSHHRFGALVGQEKSQVTPRAPRTESTFALTLRKEHSR